jgi:hypothetical protein
LGQINKLNNGFSINEVIVVVGGGGGGGGGGEGIVVVVVVVIVVVWMNTWVVGTSHLVEVEIIIKGDEVTKPGGTEPCQGVATNREEDKCHIQLQSLGCAFGDT